jgi:hypothetical protein
VASGIRHNFVIERLACRPGWFRRPRYRYYCIRCHWMFLVEGRKVCALNESCDALPEPENAQRVASFALGPCVAMPAECSWRTPQIRATSAHRKTTTVLPLIGSLGQSGPFKSIALPNPKVIYLRSSSQPLSHRPQNLRKGK